MMLKKYIKNTIIILFCSTVLTTSNICVDIVTAQPVIESPKSVVESNQEDQVSPLSVVENPKSFLNKTIVMQARFDKFSTLGLDYKTAFKSSEEYISFLIKRDDTKFDIPLSEMKLFLKRDIAEKFIDLKSNDEISIEGIVFSDALGDPWIEVNSLKIIKKAPEQK